MKNLKFNGPTDYLEVGDQTIARGKSAKVSDEEAKQVSSIDGLDVEITDAQPSQIADKNDVVAKPPR